MLVNQFWSSAILNSDVSNRHWRHLDYFWHILQKRHPFFYQLFKLHVQHTFADTMHLNTVLKRNKCILTDRSAYIATLFTLQINRLKPIPVNMSYIIPRIHTRRSVLLLLQPVLINRRYRMAFRIFSSTRPVRAVRTIPGISTRTLWERYAVY